jgi:GAF domain-containing protein
MPSTVPRDAYDRTDLEFFQTIAGTLAEASERRRLEAELQRHAAGLERTVQERTTKLRLPRLRALERQSILRPTPARRSLAPERLSPASLRRYCLLHRRKYLQPRRRGLIISPSMVNRWGQTVERD